MEDYARVFAEHQGRLVRIAELVSGDADVAADAVAEAFARTYPHWRRGRVENPAAYLRRAVLNEVMGGWRRKRPVVLDRERATEGDDDRIVEHDRVQRALAQLTERQRAAVVLRYYEDLSESDIASALDMRPGTVKSTLARGLDRLRPLLRDGEHGHDDRTKGADHA